MEEWLDANHIDLGAVGAWAFLRLRKGVFLSLQDVI